MCYFLELCLKSVEAAIVDIDAEIIRSSTAAKLDRKIPDDQSVFHHIPWFLSCQFRIKLRFIF